MIATILVLSTLHPAVSDPPQSGDQRDVVYLQTGKTIRCRVVLELQDKVAVLIGSRERWIPQSKIKRITSIQRSLDEVLTKFMASKDSVETFLHLAKMCEDRHLPHEARLFYWRILVDNPDNQKAHEALGHKRAGKSWRVQTGSSWRSFKQVEKQHADWGTARVLRSEHFEVRSNAGLRRTVITLLELEVFYRHLFDLFQKSLELREVTEPIRVYVHKDQKEFPRLSNNVDAYFSNEENILFTFLDDHGRPLMLFHEATLAVVYNLGGSKRGRKTELPGWLGQGWGDYMEGCITRKDNGRLELDLAKRLDYRIGNLQAEKNRYSLRRILNFKRTDFSASSRQKLKYAQSYALMLYMLEGDGGKYTERFLGHMRDALTGKASASAFRKLFRKELKTIEKDHLKMK